MTDYEEEQTMEIEALESIYMDEFKQLSKTAPYVYEVCLSPSQDGEEDYVSLRLKFSVPSKYPDVAPEIEVISEKGITDRHQKEIRSILNAQIEENMGMAMVFTLCEAVKEYLIDNNRAGDDDSEYQNMLRRMENSNKKDNEDEEENTRQRILNEEAQRRAASGGTPVTLETFMAWKKKFDEEMRALGKKSSAIKNDKLTGRQVWLQGIGNVGAEDEVDEAIEDYVDEDDDEDYIDGEDESDEDSDGDEDHGTL